MIKTHSCLYQQTAPQNPLMARSVKPICFFSSCSPKYYACDYNVVRYIYMPLISYFYCFLLLLATARRITEFHQVIIIGAGVSGLRASEILQQEGVPHIILESKNHIGGRVAPIHFDGEIVDMGASFFSSQRRESSFLRAVNDLKWPSRTFGSEFINNYFSANDIRIKQAEMMQVQLLELKLAKQIAQRTSAGDLSVSKAMQAIQNNVSNQPYPHRCMLQHQLKVAAELRGTDLNHLSAKHFAFYNKDTQMYPVGGMHRLLQKMFRPQMDSIHFNEKAESIEYFNKYVTIRTNKTKYMAKQVICSVPIGVLKANGVKFVPSLPGKYQQAIDGIGNGISNKLLVSFGKRFWGDRKGWLHFIEPNGQNFAIALVHPNSNKNILIYYLSEQESIELGKLTPQEIKQELTKSLLMFVDQKDFDIRKVLLSNWHTDENFLGSFSYYKVGTKNHYFQQLGRAIDKKVWFAGEHTNSAQQGTVNGAYSSGQRAAREIVKLYKVKVFLQFIPAFGHDRTKVYKKKMSESQVDRLIKQQQFKSID